VLSNWVRGSQSNFTKNPTYYGETFLDEVVIKPIPDETQRLNTLRTGGGDMMLTGSAFTKFEGGSTPGFAVATLDLNGGNVLFFNNSKAPFDDIRARTAIALATNVDDLSATAFSGNSAPVKTIFTENSPFYDAALTQIAPDKKKAQELFDELAADGKQLSFTITTPESFVKEAEWLQATLAGYDNLSVQVTTIPQAEYTPTTKAGTFELLVGTSVFGDPDPALMNFLGTGGSQNYSRYSSPQMDGFLVEARSAGTNDARFDAWASVQSQVIKDVPMYWIERTEIAMVYNQKVVVGLDEVSDLAILPFNMLSVKKGS
jgi:peptide/nickel transport system substrate-binding protein